MNIIAVVIIAVACYTAGMIHGEWRTLANIESHINQQTKLNDYERTLDRKVPPKNFI
jgi:hypothetical protein